MNELLDPVDLVCEHTFFYIPFVTRRHPLNDFETMLAIYAVCLFGGGMLNTAIASCEAMDVV